MRAAKVNTREQGLYISLKIGPGEQETYQYIRDTVVATDEIRNRVLTARLSRTFIVVADARCSGGNILGR